MNPLEQLLLGFACVGSALRMLFRPSLWAAWLPLALLRFATLALLVACAHPLVSAVMAPVVTALAGPKALHFPDLFRVLPMIFGRIDLVTLALVGSWAAGAASSQVAALAAGVPIGTRDVLGLAFRRLPQLWLAELPLWAIAWVMSEGLASWLAARGSGPLTVRLLTLGSAAALLLVRAYFSWLPALVVAGGLRASDAWHELGRLAGRGYLAVATIVVAMAAPALPVWFLLRLSGRWIDQGHPEWVAGLIALEIAAGLVTSLVAVVAVTLAWRAFEEETWR